MKIVIDIDDDLYVRLFDNGGNNVMDMRRACVAIRKGITIPKGHGRLIDADDLLEHYDNTEYFNGIEMRKIHFVQIGYINDSPTIIEADKVESEE